MLPGQAAATAAAAADDDDDFAPSPPTAPPLLDNSTEELVYVYLVKQALVCFHACKALINTAASCPARLLPELVGIAPALRASGSCLQHAGVHRARTPG
jgi:hypothetical protein